MNVDKKDFLSLATLPARLTIEEAAWFLGFSQHDIPVLIAFGLFKPLGHPTPSGSKFFATVDLQRLRNDKSWLSKASDAIVQNWRRKNNSRRKMQGVGVAEVNGAP